MSGNGSRSSMVAQGGPNLPQVHCVAISVVTARALIAPRNAVRVDILVQVTDSKQPSSTNQNRRYFASTDHPVNRGQRDSQVIRGLLISHQRRNDCTRYFLPFHAPKIADWLRTQFLEIAAVCEPLCTFLRFRDLTIQPKFGAKVVK